jgi:hypothetical protein
MRIEQSKVDYRPIQITLETKSEAETFLSIVDFLAGRCSLSTQQNAQIVKMSNAFTESLVLP